MKKNKLSKKRGDILITTIVAIALICMVLASTCSWLSGSIKDKHAANIAAQYNQLIDASKQYYLKFHYWPAEANFIGELVNNNFLPPGYKNANLFGVPFVMSFSVSGDKVSPYIKITSMMDYSEMAKLVRRKLAFPEPASGPTDCVVAAYGLRPSSEISEMPKLNRSTLVPDPELNTMRADMILAEKDDGSGAVSQIVVSGTDFALIMQGLSKIKDLEAEVATLKEIKDKDDLNYIVDPNKTTHLHKLIVDDFEMPTGTTAYIDNLQFGEASGNGMYPEDIVCNTITVKSWANINEATTQALKAISSAEINLSGSGWTKAGVVIKADINDCGIDGNCHLKNIPDGLPGDTLADAIGAVSDLLRTVDDIYDKINDLKHKL